jgi:hypothetical protein
MYSIGELYKFELDKNIFYTGYILDEDFHSIKIKTIKKEELVLNKKNVVQSKKMDSIGVYNERTD